MAIAPVLEGLERRDPAALARAISLVENQRDDYERVLSHAHARLGRGGTRRVGITGPPGAGKSTLTERLIQHYRGQELRVGVIAVRSEEHTSELQSPCNLVCRLLLEKKKNIRDQFE